MASFWDDIFSEDTLNTIKNGINTVGTFFNAASPIINAGSQLGFGIEGTRNQAALRQASQNALNQLDQLFTPDSPYALEARRQMERKDAAAGRRSQYGTRETELAAQLAKQHMATLTSPAYQALLVGANRSDYAPIAGAIGNLTGGLGGASGQAVDSQGRPINRSTGSNSMVPGANSFAQYLGGLFGPAADASIASLGGAGSALGGSGLMGGVGGAGVGAGAASLGVPDALGSMLGGQPFLPTFGTGAEGIFGSGVMAPSTGGAAPGGAFGGEAGGGIDAGSLTGSIGQGLDLLGGAGAFGGAGGALSGMGAGSLAGTVGGADALGGILGGTGFLPSYGAAGGTTATGLFGGGSAAAGGAGGAGGATGASGGLGGLGTAAGVALPAAVILGGLLSMFQQGTQPSDLSSSWLANQGGLNQQNFSNFRASDPTLDAIVGLSTNNGQFDINKYNEALQKASVGGKQFEGQALADAQQFGQALSQNPSWMTGPAATEEPWWSPYAQGTPSN